MARVTGSPLLADVRKSGTISDMNVMQTVREEVGRLPEGEPFSTARVLRLGPRASIDQALVRLMKEGVLTRVRRGVYMRPKVSRLVGVVPPGAEKVIAAIAESTGETVAPHGAEAARQLGLTTQAPMKLLYRTNGKTREVSVGRLVVKLVHSSNRQLALAGTPAGTALAALRYLGKEGVNGQVLENVRSTIGRTQFEALRSETGALPSWLSDAIWKLEHRPASATELVNA